MEWIARPPPSPEPITFDEPHFTFAVMETEPVTHMVGIIMTETTGQRWFDITGERRGGGHTHTHSPLSIDRKPFSVQPSSGKSRKTRNSDRKNSLRGKRSLLMKTEDRY